MAIGRPSRNRRWRETTNTRTNLDSIITELSGREWKVLYFHKQVTSEETMLPFDIRESTHLQNFNKINDLPIFVSDEIPIAADIEGISGGGRINVGIVPTIGDVFIATLSGGTNVLMGISTVKRYSYNNSGIYEITYSAIKFLETVGDAEELIQQLESGILEDLTYDSEYNKIGGQPLIKSTLFADIQAIKVLQRSVLSNYWKHFSDNEVMYYPIIDGYYVLDTSINDFIQYVMRLEDSFEAHDIIHLNTTQTKPTSILDVLLEEVPVSAMYDYMSILTSGIEHRSKLSDISMFPSTYMVELGMEPPLITEEGVYQPSDIGNLIEPVLLTDVGIAGKIPELFKNTYIFSPEFYGRSPNYASDIDTVPPATVGSNPIPSSFASGNATTTLEKQVRNRIEQEDINLKELLELMELSFTFSHNQRIYFTPIIIHLSDYVLLNRNRVFTGA